MVLSTLMQSNAHAGADARRHIVEQCEPNPGALQRTDGAQPGLPLQAQALPQSRIDRPGDRRSPERTAAACGSAAARRIGLSHQDREG